MLTRINVICMGPVELVYAYVSDVRIGCILTDATGDWDSKHRRTRQDEATRLRSLPQGWRMRGWIFSYGAIPRFNRQSYGAYKYD